MKILADLHHSGLYQSLQMVLEDRLGHELYRPVGKDWFKEGYWKVAEPYGNHPATVEQYLGDHTYTPGDGTPNLAGIGRGITLDEYKDTRFDVNIASIPAHIKPYVKLAERFQAGCKVIHQMGNNWPIDFGLVKNLMASTSPFVVPDGTKSVFYYQEFPLYKHQPYKSNGKPYIRSFVNTLGHSGYLAQDWQDFLDLEKRLPEYTFRSYGGSCRDGFINTHSEIAQKMDESKLGFHLKNGGDGYGHVIHQWFSRGRPVIVRGSQYKGKLAERFFEHGRTVIDIEKTNDLPYMVRFCEHPSVHTLMCSAVSEKFRELVNFDAEANRVQRFLEDLT